MSRIRIELHGGGPALETLERIEVTDDPIASDLDAMQRQWDLDRLQDRMAQLQSQPRPARRTFEGRQTLARIQRAIDQLRGQLDVWKVQNS